MKFGIKSILRVILKITVLQLLFVHWCACTWIFLILSEKELEVWLWHWDRCHHGWCVLWVQWENSGKVQDTKVQVQGNGEL